MLHISKSPSVVINYSGPSLYCVILQRKRGKVNAKVGELTCDTDKNFTFQITLVRVLKSDYFMSLIDKIQVQYDVLTLLSELD